MFLWMGLALADVNLAATFPCADGWRTCEVEGERVHPGMSKDAEGFPVAADARIGWFDLKAAPGYSPFVSMVVYPDEPARPAPVDVVPEDPVPTPDEPVPTPEEPVDTPTEPVAPEPVEPQPATDPRPPEPLIPEQPVPTPPEPVAVVTPVPEKVDVEKPPVAKVEEPVGCELSTSLEGRASLGKLSDAERTCLRGERDAAGSLQTHRDAVSRALMVDAFARGDKKGQVALLKHHLDRIDQSDPDLCMQYAMARGRAGASFEAIRWADTALENRMAWKGPKFVAKVSSVYKLRATMAHKAWERASGKKLATEKERDAEQQARGLAKTMAREWLDYVREAGLDDKAAKDLCVSAAGSKAPCK